MVVVYLKNGEKAPLPDANFVKLESGPESGEMMLHVFYADREVGQFKWSEVAGYSLDTLSLSEVSPASGYEAWSERLANP